VATSGPTGVHVSAGCAAAANGSSADTIRAALRTKPAAHRFGALRPGPGRLGIIRENRFSSSATIDLTHEVAAEEVGV
jgi:hypothetical protein